VVLKAAEQLARPEPTVVKPVEQPARPEPTVLKPVDEPLVVVPAVKPPTPGSVEPQPIRLHARVHYDPKRWFRPGDLRAEINADGLKLNPGSGEWQLARPGSGSQYRGRNFLTADLGDRVIEISLEALSLNTHKLARDLSAFLGGQRGKLEPADYTITFDDKLWNEIVPRLARLRPPAGFVLAFLVVPPLWVLYSVAGLCLRPFGSRRWSLAARLVATLLLCGGCLLSCPCGLLGVGAVFNYAPYWQHWPAVSLGDGAATVAMPGSVTTRTAKTSTGQKVSIVECRTKGLRAVNYAVAVVELLPGQAGAAPDAAFDQAGEVRAELLDKCCDDQWRREPPRSTRKLTLEDRYPGLERRFDTGGFDSKSRQLEGQVAERCYLVKGRIYVLVVFRDGRTPTNPAEFDRFLDSLKLTAEE
jgi:hypothetical protein